jgi:hypothetical protein
MVAKITNAGVKCLVFCNFIKSKVFNSVFHRVNKVKVLKIKDLI